MVPRAKPREMKTLELEWRRFTRAVMGLFGFLLIAMILRQQLEMGIHRQLWADPAQRVFCELEGRADWVGDHRRGGAPPGAGHPGRAQGAWGGHRQGSGAGSRRDDGGKRG